MDKWSVSDEAARTAGLQSIPKVSDGENKALRDWLAEVYPGVVLLEPGHCDEGIVGVLGGRLVYGYDELCASYARAYREDAKDEEEAYQMAVDWVEFNTLRSLPYAGPLAPIVMLFDPEREVYVNQADDTEIIPVQE